MKKIVVVFFPLALLYVLGKLSQRIGVSDVVATAVLSFLALLMGGIAGNYLLWTRRK